MNFENLSETERYDVLAEITNMYYNQGKTQQEIAAHFSTNRFKIARCLQEARDENIVEIKINYSQNRNRKMEDELLKKLPLQKAYVLNTQYLPFIEGIKQLGKMLADYLVRAIQPNQTIGLMWGKTVYSAISQLNPPIHQPVRVLQLAGNKPLLNPSIDSIHLVRAFASAYSGTYQNIYAPLYINNPQVRDGLLKEPLIADILNQSRYLDFVVTGIGGQSSLPLNQQIWKSYLTEKDVRLKDQCIGSIYGYVLNENGEPADIDLNRKVIAMPIENIKQAKHKILIVYGRHKARIAFQVIRQHLVNELFTDIDTAVAILKQI